MAGYSVTRIVSICVVCVFCLCWNLNGGGFGSSYGVVKAVSLEKDLTLSLREKLTLEKFKRKMVPILPHVYMKQDIYLVRWLRAQNFDLESAEEMLRSNLKWRRDQGMDSILEEDWSDMHADFPYSNDSFDKKGRPVGMINLGTWNIARVALAEEMPRLLRYMNKLLEEITQRLVKEQIQGQNVTQWTAVINLDGFNENHVCPLCLPGYADFVKTYEERYPGFADQVISINTPQISALVLDIVQPLVSTMTRKAAVYLGRNKREWMDYLDKRIPRDQRGAEFGGTRAK